MYIRELIFDVQKKFIKNWKSKGWFLLSFNSYHLSLIGKNKLSPKITKDQIKSKSQIPIPITIPIPIQKSKNPNPNQNKIKPEENI